MLSFFPEISSQDLCEEGPRPQEPAALKVAQEQPGCPSVGWRTHHPNVLSSGLQKAPKRQPTKWGHLLGLPYFQQAFNSSSERCLPCASGSEQSHRRRLGSGTAVGCGNKPAQGTPRFCALRSLGSAAPA